MIDLQDVVDEAHEALDVAKEFQALQRRNDALCSALTAVLRTASGIPKWAEDDARRAIEYSAGRKGSDAE